MKQKEASSWQSLAVLQWIVKNILEDWVKLVLFDSLTRAYSSGTPSIDLKLIMNGTLSQKTSIGFTFNVCISNNEGPICTCQNGRFE